jgi:hypothetical protein
LPAKGSLKAFNGGASRLKVFESRLNCAIVQGKCASIATQWDGAEVLFPTTEDLIKHLPIIYWKRKACAAPARLDAPRSKSEDGQFGQGMRDFRAKRTKNGANS